MVSDDSIINAVAGRASCAFSDAEHGATVLTIGGPKVAMWPPGQDPRTTHLYLADGAHALSCPGGDRCRGTPS
jgi:hypothetical protein